MALVIRLARRGAKHRDFWRMVVADSRSPRDGRFVETLGYYDPLTNPATIKLDAARLQYWVSNGAKPSEKAQALINTAGSMKPISAVAPAAVAAPAPVASVPEPVAAPAPAPVVEEPAEATEVTPEPAAEA